MKATGIVRRIDHLGRIVIPKEIRYILRINEGDPLEISTDSQGGVIFRKYSSIGNLSAFAQQYADVLSTYISYPILICDFDCVISASGVSRKEYIERRITQELEEHMRRRKSYVSAGKSMFKPVEGVEQAAAVIFPIITPYDAVGAVVLLQNETGEVPNLTEITLVQVAAAFLGKQL